MVARDEALAEVQRRIGHGFADPELLDHALTHPSAGEAGKTRPHNQRLEFLGDRVLGLIIAEHLIRADATTREGPMTKRFNGLVDKAACARAARAAALGPALKIGRGAGLMGLRDSDNALGDACEAMLAAVYLDAGLETAREVVHRLWGDALSGGPVAVVENAKTRLSDWTGKAGVPHPVYRVLTQTGPAHAPEFTVAVEVDDWAPAEGRGRNKLEAEQNAAAVMLERIGA